MRQSDYPRIMFENDGRHPLIYMCEPPIQIEEYQSAVDELAGTPVEALMFWSTRTGWVGPRSK
ncbi:MAG: hypothetical protein ACI906_001745 [Candidatus Latescibacterota bacterium]|jgi:hypothetical protein